jgi:NAD(P) transhydrogenase subunit alpha
MQIGVPRETAAGERRVALVPETVGRLLKLKHEVVIGRDAGRAAGFSDADYEKAGAKVSGDPKDAFGADIVLKVQRPSDAEASELKSGAILISLLPLTSSGEVIRRLADGRITSFGMELVPRITRAQSMDVLSSQATVAGYKAVLLGASSMTRFLPMLTTAAGTVAPAKAFVIGAGVAGLQAIATARRLGAVVSAFDVRPAVKEQINSLGAKFVEAPVVAEGAGGYAKELAEEQQKRVLETLAGHITDMDLVVTTAQVPGRPAPRLITGEMVQSMKPGSVIVDLAVESGGNCSLSKPGQTVDAGGVTIIGPMNLPATVPFHASQMYSRNLLTLLQHMTKDGLPNIDLADEITGAMVVTHAGEIRKR